MTALRVLSVVPEIFPLIKTGGLADVAGALPGALAAEDVAVRSLVPGYPPVLQAMDGATVVHRADDPYAWPDNGFRFAALSRIGALIGLGALGVYRPDVVHAHDWQGGLMPAYLHYAADPHPPSVMTVHNLAYQGQFPTGYLAALGLPAAAYAIDGVEYYGSIGYLKAGLQFADRITTVSPTYAQEICTPSGGMGLDGLLRARHAVLEGIRNGIDTEVWNPADDPHLAVSFDVDRLEARAVNKAALQTRFGLEPDARRLLFGVVSRLASQKGIDLLLEALPTLVAAGAQLALLGAGDANLEAALRSMAVLHRGSIGIQFGYDEALAHLIQGGSDALLVPSRFEPCGLTQLCALRYGALPVVARVGGLNDTVIDANEAALAAGVATGFQFAPVEVAALVAAIERALAVWRQPQQWRHMQRNAMQFDVSWRTPARRYAALYRELVATRTERG